MENIFDGKGPIVYADETHKCPMYSIFCFHWKFRRKNLQLAAQCEVPNEKDCPFYQEVIK